MNISELYQKRKERQAKIEALSERDRKLWHLAHVAYNQMGFACQGAAQQNEGMEERYSRRADEAICEFESVMLEGGNQ